MKIFIAGCSRSGTTLVRDLMNDFHDTYVFADEPYGEAPFSHFAHLSRAETNLVIKRTGECWKTLPSIPSEIGLIYCVRHPFDTLTSTHPLTKHIRKFHTSFERWSSEYDAFNLLRAAQPDRHIFILRYEDLVYNANVVQEKMIEHFGLMPAIQFQEESPKISIFTSSVEKWSRDPELYAYLQTIPRRVRAKIHAFCQEFGYFLPADYLSNGLGKREITALKLTAINNPNELEIVNGKPFFWMGGKPTILDVESPFHGKIHMRFEASPGPSHPETDQRTLRVTSGNWSRTLTLKAGLIKIDIPIEIGENEITLEVIEKATLPILPNGDQRPLIVGVRDLKLAKYSLLNHLAMRQNK